MRFVAGRGEFIRVGIRSVVDAIIVSSLIAGDVGFGV